MDHSYRHAQGAQGGNAQGGGYGRGPRFGGAQGFHQPALPEPEPLPPNLDAGTRIVAAVDDLFFVTKIQETARKLNVKVDFAKTDKDLLDRIETNGQEKPSLIIIDLNSASAKPLTVIPKLKAKLKKETSILGFVSHVQGDLKVKAQEAGCDAVMPRSAFSQNLPQLLRRHAAPEDLDQHVE
jgi:CheY-like chemotaxis protein